jgi:hypothetical protein
MLKLALIAVGLMLVTPVWAGSGGAHEYGERAAHEHSGAYHHHGVPGPLVGAGLPFLALAGAAYWLVKRRRRS